MEGKVLMKGKKEEDGGRSEKRWNEEVEGVEEEDGGENGKDHGIGVVYHVSCSQLVESPRVST